MIPRQLPIHASEMNDALRWDSTLMGTEFWKIRQMNNIFDDDIYSGQLSRQGISRYMKLQVRSYQSLTFQVQVILQFSGRG